MFSKLLSVIGFSGRRDTPTAIESARWDDVVSEVLRLMDADKYRRMESLLRDLLHSDLTEDYRITATYYMGVARFRQGDLDEGRRWLDEAVARAEALGDTRRTISPLNLLAKMLEMTGDADAAKTVRERHVKAAAAFDHLAWIEDEAEDDVVHKATGIRFPRAFGGMLRSERAFENSDGLDGIIFYRAAAPNQSWARIQVKVTRMSAKQGLLRLSDEALFWLGTGDASFKSGHFPAGGETGVRRLWPFVEKDGESWALETFFAAFGDTHVGILLANGPDFEPDDNRALLAQFDWPRPA